ncbi:MAG: hypothetical protein ACT4P3_06515 [Betaproteobacteria bacterium]
MAKLLALFLVLALGACADPRLGTETRSPEQRTAEVPYAYRAGTGTVESVTRVEHGGAAAAGGGTAGRMVGGVGYRLSVRMDDGTVQTVLQDSAAFRVGDRVRLTEDGRVIRL